MSSRSVITKDDIDTLLEKWYDTKEKIAEMQKRLEKYKKLADKIMNSEDKESIVTRDFTLQRREMTRTTISKEDVPTDIWNKYSHKCTFKSYYLTPNK